MGSFHWGDFEQPAVDVDDVGLGHVHQDFTEGLVAVLATPVERSGHVVSGTKGDDPDGRLASWKAHCVHNGQNPADGTIASTSCQTKIEWSVMSNET